MSDENRLRAIERYLDRAKAMEVPGSTTGLFNPAKITRLTPSASSYVQYDATVSGLETAIAAAADGDYIYLPPVTFDIHTATGGKLNVAAGITFIGAKSFQGMYKTGVQTIIKNETDGVLFDCNNNGKDIFFINCVLISESAALASVLHSTVYGFDTAYFESCYIYVNTTNADGDAWILDPDGVNSGYVWISNSTVGVYTNDGDTLGNLTDNTSGDMKVDGYRSQISSSTIGASYFEECTFATGSNLINSATMLTTDYVGNLAAWKADELHSSDIYESKLTRHAPAPSAAGKTIISSGTPAYWAEADPADVTVRYEILQDSAGAILTDDDNNILYVEVL